MDGDATNGGACGGQSRTKGENHVPSSPDPERKDQGWRAARHSVVKQGPSCGSDHDHSAYARRPGTQEGVHADTHGRLAPDPGTHAGAFAPRRLGMVELCPAGQPEI